MPKPLPAVLFLLAVTMMFLGGCDEDHSRPLQRDWYDVHPPHGSKFTKCYAFENETAYGAIVETVVYE